MFKIGDVVKIKKEWCNSENESKNYYVIVDINSALNRCIIQVLNSNMVIVPTELVSIDIANYLYNPSLDNEYPSFKKLIASDENTETYSRIYYFKYWDGSGEYKEEIFTRQKNGDVWQVVKNRTEKILEASNRFSLKRLLEFCAEATYEN